MKNRLVISIKVTVDGCTLVEPRESSKYEEIPQLSALRLALKSPLPVRDLISELTKINCKLDVTSTTPSVSKSTYDDIAEIASGFVCESSSDGSVSFSIREASTDEIFGAIEFESNSKTSEEEEEKEEEDTWFAVRVNKSGFSIQNSEKNSEESESSSLRSSILSSSIIAVGEDAKNAMQKPNVSLVKNVLPVCNVLGVLGIVLSSIV